ncbi:B3 domain-containing transcription factor VRN1 [Linum perenne]
MAEQAGMLMFQVKIPRFSVILLDDTAGVNKLRIPEEFAAEHGAELPNTVILKLPNGSEWKVGVLRISRRIWFHEGWQDFAQFNSLAPGYFMVFQYDSSGYFLVFIFNKTATEIDYKTRETEANKTVELERRVVDEFDVPLVELFPSLKTREKPQLRSPQPCKMLRRSEKGRSVRNSETVVYRGSSSNMAKQVRRTMASDHSLGKSLKVHHESVSNFHSDKQAQRLTFGREKSLTTAEKNRALARANAAFKTENPSFLLAMQPSYVCTGLRVSLPVNFFIRNLERERGDIVLQVPDGRVWTVEYNVIDHGSQVKAFFGTKSWFPFAQENNLKIGDVCAFELVKGGTEAMLNVVIFRATEPNKLITRSEKGWSVVCRGSTSSMAKQMKRTMNSDHHLRESLKVLYESSSNFLSDKQPQKLKFGMEKTLTTAEKTRALARANAAFKTENPFFMLVMQPTYVSTKFRVSVPVNFFISNLKGKRGDIVLQVPDGRVWTAQYIVTNHSCQLRAYFGLESWAPFVLENSLKVGDVCAFELVKGSTKPILNVVIFRATQPCKLIRSEKRRLASNLDTVVCRGSSSSMTNKVKRTMTSDHSLRESLKDKQARKLTLTAAEKTRALAQANAAFKTENPFFMIAMQPSYICTMRRLSLPVSFFMRYLKGNRGDIVLQVPDGRVWTVEYSVVDHGSQLRAYFGFKSWAPFVRENSLKVGDVCAFELVKGGTEPKMNVVIFRASKDLPTRCSSPHGVVNRPNEVKPKKSSPSPGRIVHGRTRSLHIYGCSPGSTSGNASKRPKHSNKHDHLLSVESSSVWEAAKSFSSNRPFFKASVGASHLSMGQMRIPTAFHSHIKEVYDEAELWVADKCWGVRIRKVPTKIGRKTKTGRKSNFLGIGWGAFAAGNSLKAGDVCVYELMKSEADDDSRRTMVLSVHIFRGKSGKQQHGGSGNGKPLMDIPQRVMWVVEYSLNAINEEGSSREENFRDINAGEKKMYIGAQTRCISPYNREIRKLSSVLKLSSSRRRNGGTSWIPKEFAAEHGAELPSTVVLKLPNGSEWEVGVLRIGRRIWFHEGWPDFSQFNSLAPGYFMVFQYDSSGYFLVFIFNKTATEIDYKTKEANRVVEQECEVVDDSDVPLNDQFPSPKTRQKPPLRSSRPLKLRRSNKKGMFVSNSETMACRGSSSSMAKQGERTMASDHTLGVHLEVHYKNVSNFYADKQARKLTLTAAEKTRVLARADAAFKTENPFFMITMQPSYVCTGRGVSLPVNFFVRNLKGNCGDIVLQVPDGRVWTVDYSVVDHGCQLRAYFGFKSWAPFVRENSLKVGDVCAFELVKGGTEPKLNVVIFRASEYLPNCSSSPDGVVNRLNEVKPKKSSPSPGRIAHGRNCLKVGDVCVFELIEGEADDYSRRTMVLSVHIFRGSSIAKQGKRTMASDQTSGVHLEDNQAQERILERKNSLTGFEKARVLARANEGFKSEMPFFMRVMQPAYVGTRPKLNLPPKFCLTNFKKKCGAVNLRGPDGRDWTVEYQEYGRKKKVVFVARHWTPFVRENSLKVGDVCAFELVKGGIKPVLNVVIFRATQDLLNRYTSPHRVADEIKKSSASLGKRLHGIICGLQAHSCSPETTTGKVKKLSELENNSSHQLPSIKSPDNQAQKRNPASERMKLTDIEKATALVSAAAAFESENHFFMLVMQPSYVNSVKSLLGNHGNVVLQVPDGRAWTVEYGLYESGSRERAVFKVKSWGSFVRENSLKVGDVCAFELVQGGTESIFNVVIFRATKDLQSHNSTPHQELPKALSNHVKEVYDEAELWVAAKCWKVRIRRKSKRPGHQGKCFGIGWGAFAADNSLKVGDVCVYELKGEEEEEDDDDSSSRHSANVNLQRIPKGFAVVHGAQLPNAVFLKLPSGARSELACSEVEIRCFLVVAFDITGTEIDYPAQQANGNVELVKCEVDDDSDSAESLEMHLPSTKSSDKAPLIRSLHPSKLRRMTEMGRADTASGSIMVSRGLDAGMAKQRKMNVASGHLAGEHLQGMSSRFLPYFPTRIR